MSILKPGVNAADHHAGNVNGSITLVEYGDFECPHCRRAHPFIQRLLYEAGQDLHFVFRNFPLRQVHANAFAAAVSAEAAGMQGKFWEMHDLIFDNQLKLSPDYLRSLANELRLDLPQFIADCKSGEVENKIAADFESGLRSGVNRTPTFFLNGLHVLTYDETYESLLEAVEFELSRTTYV